MLKKESEYANFKYNRYLVCQNPDTEFEYSGKTVEYKITFCQHALGYDAGYQYAFKNAKFPPVELKPSKGNASPKKEDAILEAINKCYDSLREQLKINNLPTDDLTPLLELISLTATGENSIASKTDTLKNNTDMPKQNTAAAPPKKGTKKSSLKSELDAPFERKLIDEPKAEPAPKKEEKPLTNPTHSIEITKGKMLKGDIITIEYLKKDGDSKPAECSEKHSDPPRQQFKDAFNSLAIHAALLGEFIALTKIDDITEVDIELSKDYNCSGFTVIASGDDDEGVILTAQKTLKNGKILGFNTPTTRFNDESDNAYPYLDELAESVDTCKYEIREYLNGKHAVDPQLKLELN